MANLGTLRPNVRGNHCPDHVGVLGSAFHVIALQYRVGKSGGKTVSRAGAVGNTVYFVAFNQFRFFWRPDNCAHRTDLDHDIVHPLGVQSLERVGNAGLTCNA